MTVAELVLGIEIALGRSHDECPAFDIDGDSRIDIFELIVGVDANLNGCAAVAAVGEADGRRFR